MRVVFVATLLTALVLVLAGCGGEEEEAAGERVEVSLTEYELNPSEISLDGAGTYTFLVTNDGEVEHAFEIEREGFEEETDTLDPGDSTELTVELEEGEYEIYCPVDDHDERGMVGTLTVGGEQAETETVTETETETVETETGEAETETETGESETETDGY